LGFENVDASFKLGDRRRLQVVLLSPERPDRVLRNGIHEHTPLRPSLLRRRPLKEFHDTGWDPHRQTRIVAEAFARLQAGRAPARCPPRFPFALGHACLV
jgi:hypothetical protein